MTSTKLCTKCGEEKSLEAFCVNRAASDGRNYSCKVCNASASRHYKRTLNKKDTRSYWLRCKYGIEEEEYEDILESQNFKCLICETPHDESTPKGKLHVDHCHTTNSIRGLLCHSCNVSLGLMKDSPGILRKAALYLEAHQEV